jgi:hypothetical protein
MVCATGDAASAPPKRKFAAPTLPKKAFPANKHELAHV